MSPGRTRTPYDQTRYCDPSPHSRPSDHPLTTKSKGTSHNTSNTKAFNELYPRIATNILHLANNSLYPETKVSKPRTKTTPDIKLAAKLATPPCKPPIPTRTGENFTCYFAATGNRKPNGSKETAADSSNGSNVESEGAIGADAVAVLLVSPADSVECMSIEVGSVTTSGV